MFYGSGLLGIIGVRNLCRLEREGLFWDQQLQKTLMKQIAKRRQFINTRTRSSRIEKLKTHAQSCELESGFQWTQHYPPSTPITRRTDQITSPQLLQNQDLAGYVPFRQLLERDDAIDAHQLAPSTKQILDHNVEYATPMGMKSAVGEIVGVDGGHIVRSTSRKDRHSKVYTAKGPRDRRVRLSAHTAIQFYDVQDRLGYDRPSKAVDWLIKKAQSAIDKLTELPPCYATTIVADADTNNGGNETVISADQSESSGYNLHLRRHLDENPDNNNSGFVPPPLSSVALTDSMKTFFPTSSGASPINFQTFPPDILSRTANPIQDLGLSLHTFQDPGLIHSQGEPNHSPQTDQNLFAGSHQVGYEPSYQRMAAWGNDRGAEHGGGFVFSSLPIFGQGGSAALSQRGPLQSSYSPSVSFRGWNDLSIAASKDQKTHSLHQSSLFGTRFVSDGLHGFCIPGHIPADDDSGMVSEQLSSSSMNSHR